MTFSQCVSPYGLPLATTPSQPMIVLLYTIIVLCVIVIGVVCAIQCFLLMSDAILYRRDKSTAFVSGIVMGVGFFACLCAFLWLLNNTPL